MLEFFGVASLGLFLSLAYLGEDQRWASVLVHAVLLIANLLLLLAGATFSAAMFLPPGTFADPTDTAMIGELAAVGPPAELKRTITPNLPRPSLADVFFAVVSPRAS